MLPRKQRFLRRLFNIIFKLALFKPLNYLILTACIAVAVPDKFIKSDGGVLTTVASAFDLTKMLTCVEGEVIVTIFDKLIVIADSEYTSEVALPCPEV
jgi:hypothetical protein